MELRAFGFGCHVAGLNMGTFGFAEEQPVQKWDWMSVCGHRDGAEEQASQHQGLD